MPQAYSGVDTWNLKDIRSEAKDDLRHRIVSAGMIIDGILALAIVIVDGSSLRIVDPHQYRMSIPLVVFHHFLLP
jgi:hypothetical protein